MSQEIKITVRYVEPTEQDLEKQRHYMREFVKSLNDEFLEDPKAFHHRYNQKEMI